MLVYILLQALLHCYRNNIFLVNEREKAVHSKKRQASEAIIQASDASNVKHLRQLFKHLMQATSSIWCSNNCSFQTENTIICIFLQTQNKVQTTMRNCWKDSHQVNCICDNKHHQILRLFDTFCTFSYISKLNSSTVMYQNFFTRRCSTTFITSYVGKMNVGQQTSPQS